MKIIKQLLQNKYLILTCGIFTAAAAICSHLIWNAELSRIIDHIRYGSYLSAQTLPFTFIKALLPILLTAASSLICGHICDSMSHQLRLGYASYFNDLELREAHRINEGTLVSRLLNELDEISGYLEQNLHPLFEDCLKVPLFLGWMLFINPVLTLLSCIPVAVLSFYITISSKMISLTAAERQNSAGELNRFAAIMFQTFPALKLFQALPFITEKYQRILHDWKKASIMEEHRRALLMSVSAFLSALPLLLIFMIGGLQVFRRQTTIGTLYVFINLSGTISAISMNLPERIAGFRSFCTNLTRIEKMISLR